MRWAVILLLIPLAHAVTQTFSDMGIHPLTTTETGCKTWEFPYDVRGDCTPVLLLHVISGDVNVFDNGEITFEADEPGTYRILLQGAGRIKIVLCPGKAGRGEIGADSLVTCRRMPLASVDVEKKTFRLGFDDYTIHVCNEGTEVLDGDVLPASPPFMAPRVPRIRVRIDPGACRDVGVPVVVSFKYPLVNMPPQCVEYEDPWGRYRVCTDTFPTRPEGGPEATCVVWPQKAEIFNDTPVYLEAGETSIPPVSSKTIDKNDVNALTVCSKVIEVQRRDYKPERVPRDAVLSGLILMGLAGIWARWESVKKG